MSQVKIWQEHWHQVLDRELGQDDRDIPEVAEDFRMHFDTWQLSESALKDCFSILPYGNILVDRAMRLPSAPENDDVAVDVLRNGLEALRLHINDDFGDLSDIRIIRGNDTKCLDVFMSADPPTISLDDKLYRMIREHSGEEGEEVYLFLRETLYRIASHYSIANWVIWPLAYKEVESDPYLNFVRLTQGKSYFPGWDNDGVFLFVMDTK